MTTSYVFTGAYPRALFGLSVGVNAQIVKADGTVPPVGSTVEAATGDRITTTVPYPHPELAETNPAPDAAPVDAPAAAPAPETPADTAPAADAMTSEGAPAPTA
jgi:hypothetical protein